MASTSNSEVETRNQSRRRHFIIYPLALNPAGPHLINPAGSAHLYFPISRTYDSSTDDRQHRETWCMQWEMIQNVSTILVALMFFFGNLLQTSVKPYLDVQQFRSVHNDGDLSAFWWKKWEKMWIMSAVCLQSAVYGISQHLDRG
jgi:hypothetical protein